MVSCWFEQATLSSPSDMQNTDPQQLTVEQALQQAVAHHRGGQLQAAADLYRAILHIEPTHADANQNMGVLALQSGQAAASLPYFKTALESHPGEAQHWLSYVEALIAVDQLEAARSVLEQGRQRGLQGEAVDLLAARADAANLDAAIAHREAGRYSVAVAITQGWLRTHPNDAAAHALLSQLLLSSKQETEAAAALNTAMALDPTLAVVQRNHARMLLRQQHLAEALQAAQLAYQTDTSDPENQAMLGATLIANGQLDAAVPLLASALRTRPHYAEALVNRSQLKLRLGDLPGALSDVQQALAIKPHMAQFWLLAMSIHSQLKNNAGVIGALEHYLALEPADVPRLMSLAELKRQNGQLSEASALLARATELQPESEAAWTNLGMTLHQEKRFEQAKAAYTQALAIKPGLAEALHNLGSMALSEGRYAEATAYYHDAIRAKPDLGESHLNLGHTLSDQQEIFAALETYRHAYEINAADNSGPRAALCMAILYYIGGDLQQCATRLLDSRPVMDTSGAADNSDRNYWSYLATLLSWHQQNPDITDPVQGAETLYVLGESHSLATHRMPLRYQGRQMQCSAQWIPGAKQYHLGSGKMHRSLSRFELVEQRLPVASTLLLCIGEIDCRHDEGMFAAWKKRPEKSLQALMQATVDGYLARLKVLRERRGHHLIICGVPASNANLSKLTAVEQQQFLQLLQDFNHYLSRQSLAAGMDFLDVYSMTNRGDGISNRSWHLDPINLKPSAVEAAFTSHLILAK